LNKHFLSETGHTNSSIQFSWNVYDTQLKVRERSAERGLQK